MKNPYHLFAGPAVSDLLSVLLDTLHHPCVKRISSNSSAKPTPANVGGASSRLLVTAMSKREESKRKQQATASTVQILEENAFRNKRHIQHAMRLAFRQAES